MKTLDEVIKAFEYCIADDTDIDGCSGCVYDKMEEGCHQRNLDALHYLKEYQSTQTAYIKAMADIEDNPPLTWDELKQMKGKPVWVEWSEVIIGDYFQFHGWFLVEWINDNENEIIMQNKYGKRMIRHKNDNDWQAFRKERTDDKA